MPFWLINKTKIDIEKRHYGMQTHTPASNKWCATGIRLYYYVIDVRVPIADNKYDDVSLSPWILLVRLQSVIGMYDVPTQFSWMLQIVSEFDHIK